jgi:hypothetical protein
MVALTLWSSEGDGRLARQPALFRQFVEAW